MLTNASLSSSCTMRTEDQLRFVWMTDQMASIRSCASWFWSTLQSKSRCVGLRTAAIKRTTPSQQEQQMRCTFVCCCCVSESKAFYGPPPKAAECRRNVSFETETAHTPLRLRRCQTGTLSGYRHVFVPHSRHFVSSVTFATLLLHLCWSWVPCSCLLALFLHRYFDFTPLSIQKVWQ